MENIDFKKTVESLKHQWPTIEIDVQGSFKVRADERALKTILSNLIQNALIHGKASALSFKLSDGSVQFADNGKGFDGEVKNLGQIFHRPTTSSGSGLGLYIAKSLLEKMNGDLELRPDKSGFG